MICVRLAIVSAVRAGGIPTAVKWALLQSVNTLQALDDTELYVASFLHLKLKSSPRWAFPDARNETKAVFFMCQVLPLAYNL